MNLSYDVFISDPTVRNNGLLPSGEPKGSWTRGGRR